MKILFIDTKDDNNSLRLRSLLEQMGIPFETLLVKSPESAEINQFIAFFERSDAENKNENHKGQYKKSGRTCILRHSLGLRFRYIRAFDIIHGQFVV